MHRLSQFASLLAYLVFLLGLSPLSVFSHTLSPQPFKIEVTATPLPSLMEKGLDTKTTITSETMGNKQQSRVAETLLHVPGVSLVQSGGVGSGVSVFTRGSNSNHTLVMIDGFNANDPTSANGGFDFAHLLTHGLGQIEVIRGPLGAQYGSSAIGGVIAIRTQKGQGPMRMSSQAEIGSYQTDGESANIQGAKGKINYNLTVSRFHSAGNISKPPRLRVTQRDYQSDPYTNHTTALRVGADINEAFSLSLFVRGIHSDRQYNADFLANPFMREKTKQWYHRLQADLKTCDGRWEHTFAASHSDLTRRNLNSLAPFLFPTDNKGGRTKFEWGNTLHFNEAHQVKLGIDHTEERLVITDRIGRDHTHMKGVGVFLQDNITFFERLLLQVGGRADHHTHSHNINSYRLGFVYHHLESHTFLKGNYGTSFKMPTLFQLFGRVGQFLGNPRLQPEKGKGWEVGLEQRLLAHQLCIGLTYFRNRIEHLIISPPPFTSLINLNEALIHGFESFAEVRPYKALFFLLGYTYTHTIDGATRLKLLRRPMHKASLQVNYSPDDDWRLGMGILYTSEYNDIDRRTFDKISSVGYILVNATISYQFNAAWQAFGRIENALNRRYESPHGFQQPGFAIYGGIKMTFS